MKKNLDKYMAKAQITVHLSSDESFDCFYEIAIDKTIKIDGNWQQVLFTQLVSQRINDTISNRSTFLFIYIDKT